jgi:hypothetical protein
MEVHLDNYRDERPAAATKSVRHVPITVSRTRPLLVLPTSLPMRKAMMRCLVRRG